MWHDLLLSLRGGTLGFSSYNRLEGRRVGVWVSEHWGLVFLSSMSQWTRFGSSPSISSGVWCWALPCMLHSGNLTDLQGGTWFWSRVLDGEIEAQSC